MLALCVLAGCASTHSSAPIRECLQRLPGTTRQAPVAAGHYRVQPGDTLYKIAFEHGQDFLDLVTWNHIAAPDRIRSGDILRIQPPAATTRWLPPEPAVKAKMLAQTAQAGVVAKPAEPTVATVSAIPDDAPPQRWSWPLQGSILSRFGAGLNKGIDIAGPRGGAVQAAASGRVVYAGSGLRGYGKLIIIRHGKTLLSAYAHNARILVNEGQNVSRGQTIGEIGDSDADRVMLHFEIREFGKPVDPMVYLPVTG